MGIKRAIARLTKAGGFLGLLSVGAVYGWTYLGIFPARHDLQPTGAQMAALARDEGVPASAIVAETPSESTLQNAVFTLPMLDSTRGIILVTDSFHLP